MKGGGGRGGGGGQGGREEVYNPPDDRSATLEARLAESSISSSLSSELSLPCTVRSSSDDSYKTWQGGNSQKLLQTKHISVR